jgi:hypothetical protein
VEYELMTPIEKIELTAMKVFPAPLQCRQEKMKVAKQRGQFVNAVLSNIMADGLVIRCRKK